MGGEELLSLSLKLCGSGLLHQEPLSSEGKHCQDWEDCCVVGGLKINPLHSQLVEVVVLPPGITDV